MCFYNAVINILCQFETEWLGNLQCTVNAPFYDAAASRTCDGGMLIQFSHKRNKLYCDFSLAVASMSTKVVFLVSTSVFHLFAPSYVCFCQKSSNSSD